MRERPLVVVVYDGYVQQNRGVSVTHLQRRRETEEAMKCIAGDGDPIQVRFLGFRDDARCALTTDDIVFRLRDVVDMDQKFDAVYMPMFDPDGHDQHNVVSLAGRFPNTDKYVRYSTYTRSGGRQRTPNEVLPTSGNMIVRKHRALACYASQIDMDPRLGTWPWFMDSMREYVE
jgi:LmbE family N-acetylglucosaminyl deacetylase